MIHGIDLDTAYLLNQLAPFQLSKAEMAQWGIEPYHICFDLGISVSGMPNLPVGVLFRFSLDNESDLQKSYIVTPTMINGKLLLVFSPDSTNSGLHQLFFTPITTRFDAVSFSYGYKNASRVLKDLSTGKIQVVLTKGAKFNQGDYSKVGKPFALIQTKGIVPHDMKYFKPMRPEFLAHDTVDPSKVQFFMDGLLYNHPVVDAHRLCSQFFPSK